MTKRANNEGSIYWDEKRKRFIGQFSYKEAETGKIKRKKITGTQKTKVLREGKAFLDNIAKQAQISSAVLLKNFINNWLENTVKPTVRIKTYERYECAIRRHIIPYIGDLALVEIKRENLQKYLSDLKERGNCKGGALSATTVNAVRRLLKTAMNVAVGDGLISTNPVEQTKAMRTMKHPIKIFFEEDYKKILATAKAHSTKSYLIMRLAFETGFRIGEIFGLEYGAVDFSERIICVRQTIVSTKHGKKLQIMAKNSSSIRSIKVSQKLIDELKYFQSLHTIRKEKLKNKYEQEHDFIIENIDGSFCDPAYFSDKVFKKVLLKRAGLSQEYRMHDCRHTHASWLIAKGVKPIVISKRLGHKSIRTTLDIYSHLISSTEEEAVQALENVL